MYCSYCGYPLGSGDNYCPNCGHMVPGREKTVLKKAMATVRDLQKSTGSGRHWFRPWGSRSGAAVEGGPSSEAEEETARSFSPSGQEDPGKVPHGQEEPSYEKGDPEQEERPSGRTEERDARFAESPSSPAAAGKESAGEDADMQAAAGEEDSRYAAGDEDRQEKEDAAETDPVTEDPDAGADAEEDSFSSSYEEDKAVRDDGDGIQFIDISGDPDDAFFPSDEEDRYAADPSEVPDASETSAHPVRPAAHPEDGDTGSAPVSEEESGREPENRQRSGAAAALPASRDAADDTEEASGETPPEITVRQQAERSMEKIAREKGYFCYACGNYISLVRAEKSLDPVCRVCGAEIIFPESSRRMLARSVLSNILSDVTNRPRTTRPARPRVEEYYRSAYYHRHHTPFEEVVASKRLIGDYLVDRQLQDVISSFPDRAFHIYTDVLIPEPNGSYQEIDALVVYGKIIFVLECKNRSGKFFYERLSAKTWVQELGNETTQKQKNIVSPVLQNEDHICALKHYLFTRGLTVSYGISFINLVVLGSYAEYMDDFDMKDDVYDRAVLTLGKVCSCDQLSETISGMIRTFDQGIRDLDAELVHGDFSEEAAERIEFALMPQTGMSAKERETFLAARKEMHDSYQPLPWRYYVLEGIRHRPYVIRTNDIYLEYCSRNVYTWEEAHPAGLVLDIDGVPAWNPLIQSVIDKSSGDGARGGTVRAAALPDRRSIVRALSLMEKGKAYHPEEDKELQERIRKKHTRPREEEEQAYTGYAEGSGTGQEQWDTEGAAGQSAGYSDTSGWSGDAGSSYCGYDDSSYGSQGTFTGESQPDVPVFFAGCDTLQKLNTRFKLLSRAFHPDEASGDEETFKRMSEEYDRIRRELGG